MYIGYIIKILKIKYIKIIFLLSKKPKIDKLDDNDALDIITISFNNFPTIKRQYELLNKNLKDAHYYSIMDNSTNKTASKEIKDFAKSNNIIYIKVPNTYIGLNPSDSHGIAINWAIKNFINIRKAKYFGVIDHDIFPIHEDRIIPILKNQHIYGLKQERSNKWYLWPGFCFFEADFFKDIHFNFLPVKGLDTGGGNYSKIYKNLDKTSLQFPSYTKIRVGQGEIKQMDYVERIGEWMHTINASLWFNGSDKEKNDYIENIMNKSEI